ncbi:MAG: DnaJ domain-containing protein [Chloroflexi bacterium]|nr:DnaJ domain-containing protein [Chloroflexota bacterium]
MPETSFRGDPYRVLEVPRDATSAELKRAWRELAREHHPDRAVDDVAEQRRLTARMARINAAYDLLMDPVRRARHDASPAARRAAAADVRTGTRRGDPAPRWADDPGYTVRADGPPPPPSAPPVTARFDMSATLQRRDTVTGGRGSVLPGQDPRPRHIAGAPELRASTPTGPVRRRATRRPVVPTLEEARATTVEFGRFQGTTLGEIADREPTYIDWIARTITRDRDLVLHARVIAADLDARGVERTIRPPRPGFGTTPEPELADHPAW